MSPLNQTGMKKKSRGTMTGKIESYAAMKAASVSSGPMGAARNVANPIKGELRF
jgi:methylglyoxal synthase